MKEIEPQPQTSPEDVSPEPIELLSVEALAAKNFYERLQVDPKASEQEIRNSYLRLAEAYYRKSDAFFLLEEAYNELIDPDRRAAYDTLIEEKTDLKSDIIKILDNPAFISAISTIESRIKEYTNVDKSVTKKEVVEFFKDLILEKLVKVISNESTAFRSESSARLIKAKVEHLVSCLGINQEEIMKALEEANIVTPATS